MYSLFFSISQRFFGIPPFRFYALADGIQTILSRCSPTAPLKGLLSYNLISSWAGKLKNSGKSRFHFSLRIWSTLL